MAFNVQNRYLITHWTLMNWGHVLCSCTSWFEKN